MFLCPRSIFAAAKRKKDENNSKTKCIPVILRLASHAGLALQLSIIRDAS